jgi:hypothetical protein
MTAAMNPMRFSISLALKALNPLDKEEEQGEDGHSDRYVQQIPHHNSLE